MITNEKVSIDKEQVKKLFGKILPIFKNLLNVLVIAIAMVIGFYASQLYNKYNSTLVVTPVCNLQTTTVALNEQGELIFGDRATHKYTLYSKEFGQAIFNLYAKDIYAKQKSK